MQILDLMNFIKNEKVEYKPLGEILDYEQPTKYIVKKANYSDDFKIPVLTAGQSFILGYTDEKQGIYQASQENPCIIFDDFTTSFHWVDFPFKIKSSAMKILNLNQLHEVQTAKSVVGVEGECERGEGATSHLCEAPIHTCKFKPLSPLTKKDIYFKFVYYAMKCIKYESTEHQRQWINKYSHFKIPLPPLKAQEEIVEILDKFDALVNDLKSGIPAEIKARSKQYEYYRQKLLSFREA